MKRIFIDRSYPQRIFSAEDNEQVPNEYLVGKRITGVLFQGNRLYLEIESQQEAGLCPHCSKLRRERKPNG